MLPLMSGPGDHRSPIADVKWSTVYVFRGWREAVCTAASGEAVLQTFGDLATFELAFGGYMTFGRVFSSNEYLGVWGNRNCSWLRRMLRERLGDLTIVHAPPPVRHSGNSLASARLSTSARRQLELQIKRDRPLTF